VPVNEAKTDDPGTTLTQSGPTTTLAQSDTTSPLLNRAKEIMKKVELAMAQLKEGRLDVDAQKTNVNVGSAMDSAEALVAMLVGALKTDKAQIAAQAMGKEARVLLNNSAKGADNEKARVELGKVYKAADDVALEAMRVELDAMEAMTNWVASVLKMPGEYNEVEDALTINKEVAEVEAALKEAQALADAATRDSSKLDKAWAAVRNTQKRGCDAVVVIVRLMNRTYVWQQEENASALKKAVMAMITEGGDGCDNGDKGYWNFDSKRG
jgi:hypothetical protein